MRRHFVPLSFWINRVKLCLTRRSWNASHHATSISDNKSSQQTCDIENFLQQKRAYTKQKKKKREKNIKNGRQENRRIEE